MTISTDLVLFNFKLFSAAYSDTCSSSRATVCEWDDGTNKYVSSAYLFRSFSSFSGRRSDELST